MPAQAVRVSMEGLELFDDLADITNDLDDLLLEKDILVINKTLDSDSVSNRNQNVLSAELLLTSDGDIQTRLNDHVRDIILKKIDPTYHLSSDKVSQEAYISCVTADAVYVQLASKGKKQLDELIKNVAKEFLDNVYFKPRPVLSLNPSKLYMAKSVADKLWHRVKLIEIINDNEARAFCVDEGNEMTVKKTELVSLEDLPELLSLFPHQKNDKEKENDGSLSRMEKRLESILKVSVRLESRDKK
ncbi:uncharacterized protein LOC111643511 [Copidosoma floridanum]|uniref:uncharacterized protein LOC111643511 n=1 Tax=Copidosoma floridanum TaxID=29053 RepID=UPI000C6FBD41|nr:uncharacterized protein LOC111643511 [Copidosoma floridanum]